MVVKFIVTTDGIIFGDRYFREDYHSEVAKDNGVPSEIIRGGGLADLAERWIFGTSYGFGSYDPEMVRAFLPDWRIDQPSDY